MARRTSDGALLWHYTFPSCHMVGEPPVNTTIYISGYCATGEETDAFQAETGQLLWRVSLPEGLITVTPTPTVVYVDDGANPSPGTDRFFALDANTGQLLWKREIPQRSVGADTHIWAANGTAVYTTINGVWSPLGARDGKPIWEFPSDGQSAPGTRVILQSSTLPWLLSHDLVYVADQQQFEAFQASTGKLHWDLGLPTQEYLSFLTLSQGVIYLGGSLLGQQAAQPNRQKQEIYAIGADTGKVLWHTIQTQQPQVMTQDGVYFAAATGQPYHYSYSVFALQSSSGKHMWTYQV